MSDLVDGIFMSQRKLFSADEVKQMFGPSVLDSFRSDRLVTRHDLIMLAEQAGMSPRLRAALPTINPFDRPQQFYNYVLTGTYVQPHAHQGEWESFERLDGAATVLFWDRHGHIERMVALDEFTLGLRIPPGVIHSVVVPDCPGSVTFLETRPGPYLEPLSEDMSLMSWLIWPEEPLRAFLSGEQVYIEAWAKYLLAAAPSESELERGMSWLQQELDLVGVDVS